MRGYMKTWIFLIFILLSNHLYAVSLFLVDFDNAIVEHREDYKGAFDTLHKVYLVERRTDIVLPNYEQLEPIVEISSWDFDRLYGKFSKGPALPGSMIPITLTDGRKIIPGMYEIREVNSYETYHYFGKSFEGRNYLLEQQKAAEKLTKNSNREWKGRFYSLFQAILKVPQNKVMILTMRSHSQRDFKEWGDHLIKKNEITRQPDEYRSARSAEMDHYDMEARPAHRKVNFAIEKFQRMLNIPLTEADTKLDHDGKTKRPLHSLIFWDDSPKTIELFAEKIAPLVRRNPSKVKVIFLSAETHQSLRKKKYYEQTVITSDGGFRKAKLEELIGEPNLSKKEIDTILNKTRISYCGKKLKGKGK